MMQVPAGNVQRGPMGTDYISAAEAHMMKLLQGATQNAPTVNAGTPPMKGGPPKSAMPPIKGGPKEHLIYASNREINMLKAAGGAGLPTKYGVKSYEDLSNDGSGGYYNNPSNYSSTPPTQSDPTYSYYTNPSNYASAPPSSSSASDSASSRGSSNGNFSYSNNNSNNSSDSASSRGSNGSNFSYGNGSSQSGGSSNSNGTQTLAALATVISRALGNSPSSSQSLASAPQTNSPQSNPDYMTASMVPPVPYASGALPQQAGPPLGSMAQSTASNPFGAFGAKPPVATDAETPPPSAVSALAPTQTADGGPPQGFMTPQQQQFDRMQVNNGSLLNQSLGGQMGLPSAIVAANEMAKTAYGETGKNYANANNLAAVNQVMLNRMGLMANQGQYGGNPTSVLSGFDANGYDQARVNGVAGPQGNSAYQSATFGSPQLGAAAQSLAGQLQGTGPTLPAGVMDATNYYNPAAASPSWANGMNGTRFGPHVFGNPDAGRSPVVVASNRPTLGATQVASANLPAQIMPADTPAVPDYNPFAGLDPNSQAYKDKSAKVVADNNKSFPVVATKIAKKTPAGAVVAGLLGLADKANGGFYGNSGSSPQSGGSQVADNSAFAPLMGQASRGNGMDSQPAPAAQSTATQTPTPVYDPTTNSIYYIDPTTGQRVDGTKPSGKTPWYYPKYNYPGLPTGLGGYIG